MKFVACVVLAVFLFSGCSKRKSKEMSGKMVQFSTMRALMSGEYEGWVSCEELLGYGDFGIGTFDGLDGEMVVLDGTVHQVQDDGRVYIPNADVKVPFASVVFFRKDVSMELGLLTFEEFKEKVGSVLGKKGVCYAIRVDGDFARVRTRSVPKQKEPYEVLEKVVAGQQVIFNLRNVRGTLVGFWFPECMGELSGEGYHFHFLTDDLSGGGYVLDFELEKGTLEVMECPEFLFKTR